MTTANELESLLSARGYRHWKPFRTKQGRTTLAEAVVVVDDQYREGRLDLGPDDCRRAFVAGLLRGFGRVQVSIQ